MADDGPATGEKLPKWVRITSNDGFSYIVDRKVACASSTLEGGLSHGFSEAQTSTCTIDHRGAVTEKVVEYLAYKSQWTGSKGPIPDFAARIPPEIALELMMAADFLGT